MPKKTNFQTVLVSELALTGLTSHADAPRPLVLVVDDEHVIADTLAAILARNGISALVAYDGASALDMARLIPPDLLLSDVVMPGMSGVDLAIAILKTAPDCRIMMFSGQAATVDLLGAANYPGHDFTVLQKPIHPTDLLARIAETLETAPSQPLSIAM
jgi:DNA-binding response OmpR family regulator